MTLTRVSSPLRCGSRTLAHRNLAVSPQVGKTRPSTTVLSSTNLRDVRRYGNTVALSPAFAGGIANYEASAGNAGTKSRWRPPLPTATRRSSVSMLRTPSSPTRTPPGCRWRSKSARRPSRFGKRLADCQAQLNGRRRRHGGLAWTSSSNQWRLRSCPAWSSASSPYGWQFDSAPDRRDGWKRRKAVLEGIERELQWNRTATRALEAPTNTSRLLLAPRPCY